MRKLFGTDGIRGKANQYPMTAEMMLKVGKASAKWLGKEHRNDQRRKNIVIGKDSRISGDMLESAVAAGICSNGMNVYLAGILPTPGIAYLASSMDDVALGIMISASHNPYGDNGIKIFNQNGYKLSDEQEAEIESLILNADSSDDLNFRSEIGRFHPLPNANEMYADFLKQSLPDETTRLDNLRIVMDCSNGATYHVAPKLFSELGARVEALFNTPDGKNINDQCGSQHTQTLKTKVKASKADIGLAFDGDGDRLIAIDENGDVVTGDRILAICVRHMKRIGKLKNNTAVSTVMSNIGLKIALEKLDIHHLITDVGDRYVLQEMIRSGAVIGGEDSGHMIFLEHHTTGDGILTALKLIEAIQAEKKPLSQLAKIMDVYPQVLLNVEVQHRRDIQSVPNIVNAIHEVEQQLGNEGRVLVRYSGTQPLLRIMVEGPTLDKTRKYCEQISDVVKAELG